MRKRGQGSKWIAPWRRLLLYALDRWRCVYCLRSAWSGTTLTLDHLQPQCLGGGTESTNLITCCWDCNTMRHQLPIHDFVSSLADERSECVTAISERIKAAVRRRQPQHNRKQLEALKVRAKRWHRERPAWLVAYRKRASNQARKDEIDAERMARRERMAGDEAERWAAYDAEDNADTEQPPAWTDEDIAAYGVDPDQHDNDHPADWPPPCTGAPDHATP